MTLSMVALYVSMAAIALYVAASSLGHKQDI